ncbi:MAG: hypothetical protein ACI4D3_09405 [Lachnospiraceae bacterium]
MTMDNAHKKNCRNINSVAQNNADNFDEETDILINAIGEIDFRYIEEARLAVSPDSSRKISAAGWRKRLIHSPAAVLAASACLTLLVLAGASRAGILQNVLIPLSKNSSFSGEDSSANNMADAAEYVSEEINEVQKTDSDADAAGNAAAEAAENTTDYANEKTANEEKTADDVQEKNTEEKSLAESADTQILTVPPALNLYICGSSVSLETAGTEDTSCFSALQNEYHWTFQTGEKQEATASTSISDASCRIWNVPNLPVLSLKTGSSIDPQFDDAPPDSLSVRCLAASDLQTGDPEQHCVDISIQEDGTFTLPEKDRSYIVEITAVWDNDLYSGSCTYGFRADYTE